MAAVPGKRTEVVKVCMDERLFIDLNRLAILDDRKLAEYVYLVLWKHAYGNSARIPAEGEGPDKD
jgi:hypothetical protein